MGGLRKEPQSSKTNRRRSRAALQEVFSLFSVLLASRLTRGLAFAGRERSVGSASRRRSGLLLLGRRSVSDFDFPEMHKQGIRQLRAGLWFERSGRSRLCRGARVGEGREVRVFKNHQPSTARGAAARAAVSVQSKVAADTQPGQRRPPLDEHSNQLLKNAQQPEQATSAKALPA